MYPVPTRRDGIQTVNIPIMVTLVGGALGVAAPVGIVARCTSFRVWQGQTVRVRAYNGQPAGNAAPVVVCSSGSVADLMSGLNCEVLPPGVEVPFPVSDTGNILITGSSYGDAVQVTIKG